MSSSARGIAPAPPAVTGSIPDTYKSKQVAEGANTSGNVTPGGVADVTDASEQSESTRLGPAFADAESFERLFREMYAPLVRFATTITKNERTAQDVLQDVFLKLWRDRDTVVVQVSLKALLYTMTRNRALNTLRNRNRVSGDDINDLLSQRPDSSASAADVLHARSLEINLRTWIDEMPQRRREAFTLSRYHGLSHAEIATIMEVGERTIDTHILLALRELRRRVDEYEEGH